MPGGKGVATGLGSFTALHPAIGLMQVAVYAVAVLTLGYSSVGSMSAAVVTPLAGWIWTISPAAVVAGAVGAAMIVSRHRGNIARRRTGSEPRLLRRGAPSGADGGRR